MQKKIAVLSGDGIGPEVMLEALKVLEKIQAKYAIDFSLEESAVGGAAIDKYGLALPKTTIDSCKSSDAILFGSVGGPKWEPLPPEKQPERAALLPLRKMFDLYANFRPAIVFKSLVSSSFLREDIVSGGFDILVIRELTGGIYFGLPKGRELSGSKERAFDTMVYSREEIERIAHVAFKAARSRSKRVTSIDKANVLTSMVLWRKVVNEVSLKYPDITLESMYIDAAAMKLVSSPKSFDVILCPNMFGDILSDEAAMLTGSIGLLPSASVSSSKFGLYEPVGGSAPDIAGKGIANPIAQILSLALMLKHSFGLISAYDDIFLSVNKVLEDGYRTKDIMQAGMVELSTSNMGTIITDYIAS